MSPDLSLIEHLWDQLDRAIRLGPVQPRNLQELTLPIQQEWAAIPTHTTRTLIGSKRRRCRAVVNADITDTKILKIEKNVKL